RNLDFPTKGNHISNETFLQFDVAKIVANLDELQFWGLYNKRRSDKNCVMTEWMRRFRAKTHLPHQKRKRRNQIEIVLMKGIFWSSNGFKDPKKHRFISDLTKEQNLNFIAISKTGRSDFMPSLLLNAGEASSLGNQQEFKFELGWLIRDGFFGTTHICYEKSLFGPPEENSSFIMDPYLYICKDTHLVTEIAQKASLKNGDNGEIHYHQFCLIFKERKISQPNFSQEFKTVAKDSETQYWKIVDERIEKKLSSWKGKLVLINSILTSLTMFMLFFFEVDKMEHYLFRINNDIVAYVLSSLNDNKDTFKWNLKGNRIFTVHSMYLVVINNGVMPLKIKIFMWYINAFSKYIETTSTSGRNDVVFDKSPTKTFMQAEYDKDHGNFQQAWMELGAFIQTFV
ncbi:hypothetical protein ACJX0J_011372, partial [Zea mays]